VVQRTVEEYQVPRSAVNHPGREAQLGERLKELGRAVARGRFTGGGLYTSLYLGGLAVAAWDEGVLSFRLTPLCSI
jgi:hypothetical protein